MMKRIRLAFELVAVICLSAKGSVDMPKPEKFGGNAYHDGGWISYGTDINASGKYLQFDAGGDYLYSPRYAAPIRKIIFETRCSSKSEPSRYLTVTPYVNGVEDSSRLLTVKAYAGENELAVSAYEFSTGEGVDAFRIGMSGSSGTWGIVRLAVIWGEKTADDESVLRDFAQQLPPPEDVHVEALSKDTLALAASPVEGAASYVFELSRLTGCPRTDLREDFAAAPNLADGWTFGETNNVKLSSYSGESSTSVDKESSEDRYALKIERRNTNDAVRVEILSPVAPAGEPFCECSYWSKCSDRGSDQITVYGQKRGTEAWISLADSHEVTTTKDRQTIPLAAEQDICRIKFVFTAEGATCKTCAFDSLTVGYGGNEERTVVATVTNAVASCEMMGLDTARYGYRAKALGATEGKVQYKDSSWSEEQVVDLAWAEIELTAPTEVVCQTVGDKLVVGWTAVPDAERYVVSVFRADDLATPMATVTTKSTSASVEVEELGEYVVKVTAISPGNVSTATATVESYEIKLGKLTGLKAVATAADAIEATWAEVPMAEGYQAKLFKVEGDAGTVAADFSLLPDVWPEGWSSSSWLPENLSKSGLKFTYVDQWAATGEFPAGVTKVVLSVKSNSSVAGRLANQYLAVEVSSGREGDWQTCATIAVAEQTISKPELEFPVSDNIRRIRFKAGTHDGNFAPAIQLGAVTVNYGNYTRTEVASVGVGSEGCVASFAGLDRLGRYVVVVTPQPSEGTDLEGSSQIVDLASEYFRPVGPVSLAGCKGGVYAESFDSLAAVKAKLDLSRAPLKWWQLHRGSGAAQTLNYTSGTNSTSGGVYCYSDADATTNSYMIGTVASGTIGCSLGIAFVNDTDSPLRLPTLTFTSVQRNFKANPATYVLEWLVTDGTWSIGTESENWKSLVIPETAPFTSETQGGRDEHREACITLPHETGDEDYKLARLQPGQVVIFRWRHEKLASGPMMGIDDVHVEFPVLQPGFGVIFK